MSRGAYDERRRLAMNDAARFDDFVTLTPLTPQPKPSSAVHRFHPFTGQFRDRPLEVAFRNSVADQIRRDSRPSLIMAALVFLMFGISDYNYLGVSTQFYLLVSLRVTVALSCLLLARAIAIYDDLLGNIWLLNIAPLVIATGIILIVPLRPESLATQLTAVVVTIIAFYLYIPNVLTGILASSLYLSIGFLVAAQVWAGLSAVGVLTFSLLLLMANLAGQASAQRLARLQRQQFALLAEERDTNQRLMYEINHRESLEAQLRQRAQKDDLTGLDNRRHFMEIATRALQSARDRHQPFSICMLDVDNFKQINDTWGHGQGDKVLREIAKACLEVLRPGDLIGRFGGEEFIVALPGGSVSDACPVAERLRQHIDGLHPERDLGIPGLTVSITVGIAEVRPEDSNLEPAITRADEALYLGKRSGHNRVVRAEDNANTDESPADPPIRVNQAIE